MEYLNTTGNPGYDAVLAQRYGLSITSSEEASKIAGTTMGIARVTFCTGCSSSGSLIVCWASQGGGTIINSSGAVLHSGQGGITIL